MRRMLVVGLVLLAGGLGWGTWFLAQPDRPDSHPDVKDASARGDVAGDWPGWRGPNGSGIVGGGLPVRWSTSEGVLWNVPVSGQGHSSPVVAGEQVYLTTAEEEPEPVQSLLCFDARTGELRWKTPLVRGGFMACHPKNTHASSTPVWDGRRVHVAGVAHGHLWVTAVDPGGEIAWQEKVGPFVSERGYGASLALHGKLVIVAGESKSTRLASLVGTTSYLAALDGETGKVVWRVPRPRAFSYGTPIVAHVAGRAQLLLAGAESVSSYDPATGASLWQCEWEHGRTAGAVACDADHVYASRTIPRPEVVCIRADGSGNVTRSHLVWRNESTAADVPSPLVLGGRVYLLTDAGFAVSLDARTGEEVWRRRLGAGVTASLLAGDGRLYAFDERGTGWVFADAPTYQPVARNNLERAIQATPAVSEGRLIVRTVDRLVAIAANLEGRGREAAHLQPKASQGGVQ